MYIDVDGNITSTSVEVEGIKEKLGRLQKMPELEVKETILIAMCMTGSYVKDKNVFRLLPEDSKTRLEEFYKKLNEGHHHKLSSACIKRDVTNNSNPYNFYIDDIWHTEFKDNRELLTVDLEKLELKDLISITLESMKAHRKADNFFRMGEIDGEMVPDLLDTTMSSLEKLLDREFVSEQVIPQIEQNGIGKVEDVLSLETKVEEAEHEGVNLEVLSVEELEKYEDDLDGEIEFLQRKIDYIKQKNAIITRIKDKAGKFAALKQEIESLEHPAQELPNDLIQ